jgi:hypothetical protein
MICNIDDKLNRSIDINRSALSLNRSHEKSQLNVSADAGRVISKKKGDKKTNDDAKKAEDIKKNKEEAKKVDDTKKQKEDTKKAKEDIKPEESKQSKEVKKQKK